ncbi:MAG: D-tyrosyl-tRNA(Tyr) deacylase [Oscillospiraceae bacterium]|nr:D-tyrosyl-tRNA(Tyr) deacylase [Oscillospiraceae bacterium]
MRAVVTRVRSASVEIGGTVHGRIGPGLLVLLGIHQDDGPEEARKIADKICGLRIFEDEDGRINVDPVRAGAAELLIISQFTLFADCRSRRPGFSHAARPETAIPLYELTIEECRARGFHVETGSFGAKMLVTSENDGPFTIILDNRDLSGKT